MGNINLGRLILGGLVAGIVADILGYLVDGVWLAQRWADGMSLLGRTEFSSKQIIWFNLLGLVTGLVAVWVYVGIRSRFGAGPRTAVLAGLAVWVLGALVPNLALMCVTGLFSRHLTLYTTLGALGELVVGTVAGAALYKEA
jgi:hypothetical protein